MKFLEYLHGKMVDKTQPPSGMFQKHVGPLLERLPLLMVKHVLGLEGLIYRQVNRIIRIRYSPRRLNRRIDNVVLLVVLLVGLLDVKLVLLVAFLRSLNRSRNPFMVCFIETRCSLAAKAV